MDKFLKTLSELNGVSGSEESVRNFLSERAKPYADEIKIDSMGNIIAFKRGLDSSKTLLVTANMDEPGFIISKITDKGYLKFKQVGNVDPRKIISKKVVVGSGVRGVIGMKAIHLQTRAERENVVEADKLFIDIGAEDKESAEKRVKIGDYAAFDTNALVIDGRIKGKALDRSGCCAALMDVLEGNYPYDVCACFLAQSEVGSRGAKIIAHSVNADAVLSITSADTTDMYGKTVSGTKLDGGTIINYADKNVIADKELTAFMSDEAEKMEIKVQKKPLTDFASDAGALQYNAGGVRCISAAVPCRYSHSPVSIMSLGDVSNTASYVRLFLNKIGEML